MKMRMAKMAIIAKPSPQLRRIFANLCQRCASSALNHRATIRNHHCEAGDSGNYDIAIVGGGMVGVTLAVALAKNENLQTKNIVLLEGGEKHKYKLNPQYSNRVVALNKQARTLLSSIGAWRHIEAGRFTPVHKMQVWDAYSDAMITFNEDNLSQEIAYIIENDLVLHAVQTELEEKSNVHVLYNTKVKEISLANDDGDNSEVTLESGEKLTSKLLIGADGFKSRVRQAMGSQYISWDYEQMGLVATVKLSEPTKNVVAWQRFLPTGPVALLPLTDDQSSLVWSLPTAEAKRLLKVPEEEFVDGLNDALWKTYPTNAVVESGMKALQQLLDSFSFQKQAFRQLHPSVTGIVEKSRAAFPLGFGHATSYAANGVVLIGDAAHRVHPLAGQGVNLGFGDVTTLIKVLNDAVKSGSSLGNILYLSQYETMRQRENVPIMVGIDTLHRLYRGTATPVVLTRSLGLQFINALAPVKRILLDRASGAR